MSLRSQQLAALIPEAYSEGRLDVAALKRALGGEAIIEGCEIMELQAEFTDQQMLVPWRSMRGMHSRIAHGYFDINLDVVWDTVQTTLPTLLELLPEQ